MDLATQALQNPVFPVEQGSFEVPHLLWGTVTKNQNPQKLVLTCIYKYIDCGLFKSFNMQYRTKINIKWLLHALLENLACINLKTAKKKKKAVSIELKQDEHLTVKIPTQINPQRKKKKIKKIIFFLFSVRYTSFLSTFNGKNYKISQNNNTAKYEKFCGSHRNCMLAPKIITTLLTCLNPLEPFFLRKCWNQRKYSLKVW